MSKENAEKVMSLVRKALSTHSVEESRTCALTAVQHIIKYKLLVVDPTNLPPPPLPKRPKAPTRRPYGNPSRAASKVSFNTSCMLCERPIYAGSQCCWLPAYDKVVCGECYETEIMGNTDWEGQR